MCIRDSIPTIRAVRVAAMGPLGGIGDALFWLTLVPITAGITSNMAINGNAAAPIIFLVIFNVVQFALRFWLMNWSYKLGTSAIDALTANMQAFTRCLLYTSPQVVPRELRARSHHAHRYFDCRCREGR